MAKKIILYGDVGSEIIASQLEKELRVANGEDVVLHIHSYGGSVFEGLAIVALLEQYSGKIDVVCEGICASMASVIAMIGRNIRMSEHGYMMIHAPSTATFGSKVNHQQSAILLGQLEETMQKLYAKRIQDQSTLDLLMDGQDHWFTAQDAMQMGLIDGIVAGTEATAQKSAMMKKTQEVWAKYNADAPAPTVTPTAQQIPATDTIMMWQAKAIQAEKEVERLRAELEGVRKSNISIRIEKAVAERKINASEKEVLYKIAEKGGVDVLDELLSTMKPRVTIHSQLEVGGTPDKANRSLWGWDKWQLEDPRGLEAMQRDGNPLFEKLYQEKFKNKQ